MATYTITIDERSQVGRTVLQLMRGLTSVFKISKQEKAKTTSFERSQKDIAEGRKIS